MGVETALLIGLSVAGAAGQMSNAKAQAKATIAEGNIATRNKAQQVQAKAASQQVNFLNSGLTLEGTPMAAIMGTYDTRIADIDAMRTNYNRTAKNQISAGRTQALSTLAGSFAGASIGGGGMGDLFTKGGSMLPDSFAYGLNNLGFGESAYDMLEYGDLNSNLGYTYK